MTTTTTPVGLCSHHRAAHIGMAAAYCGGAIYVRLSDIPGLGAGYVCYGTLPGGEPVPDTILDAASVLEAMRAEAARLRADERYYGSEATEAAAEIEDAVRYLESRLS